MDYRDWEQKLKEKLEASSPEEAGFSVNADDIWKHIATKNKLKKRDLLLFRPVISHIAAVFLGILMSMVAYFLVFQNPKSPKTVALTKDIQQKLPIIHETQNHTTEHAEKNRSTALKNLKHRHSENIAATQPRQLNQKTSQTTIKPEITKDSVAEYANASHNNPKQQQIMASATPRVMHWRDIEDHYKNKSEPKYWAKLVRRIDKRFEKDEKSENNKAPVITWIQTFK